MMKSKDFISMLKKALNSNTFYCLGMWGQIIDDNVINTKTKQYPSFYTPIKVAQLKSLKGKNYFGFDCVCLVKSILWGWEGSTTKSNGGAKYGSNGVPDVNADTMITKCRNVSTDFNKIVPGALVWVKGHVGVYIGDGQCIECTTSWTSKVLQSALKNIGAKGQFERSWTKWGLLPYVDYSDQAVTPSKPATPAPAPTPVQKPAAAPTVKTVTEGCKVKLNKGAKTTKGVKLASFVYDRVHIATNVRNGECVIKYNGVVVARVYTKDCTVV